MGTESGALRFSDGLIVAGCSVMIVGLVVGVPLYIYEQDATGLKVAGAGFGTIFLTGIVQYLSWKLQNA